jgi:integrase
MAKATKLPSGNWRAVAFVGTDENGKKIRKSFTADTKREAELLAAQYLLQKHHNDEPKNKTFSQAMSDYINDNNKSFSASTARGYRTIQRNLPEDLMCLPIAEIDIQSLRQQINDYAENRAPKTVENAIRLIVSVLKAEKIYISSKELKKPAPKKAELYIPTHEEVTTLLNAVRGTRYEMPIIFGAFLGMRRGEIVALRWEDVDFENNCIHIRRAVAMDDIKKEWVEKSPKTYSGTRTVPMFAPIREYLERAERVNERITQVPASSVTDRFPELLDKAGLHRFRFHDLRHYFASSMLALNIPNKYIIDIIGHKDDVMLEKVYFHLMTDKKREVYNTIDNFYTSKFSNIETKAV